MSPGREIFERDIMPLLNVICADCHSNPNDEHDAPDFLDTADGQYYESLVSRVDFVGCDASSSLLVTKGLHPGHPGGKLTEPQELKMNTWLSQEATDRFPGNCTEAKIVSSGGGGGSGGAPQIITPDLALEQFRKCMTLDDWRNTGMPSVGETIATDNGIPSHCYSCHQTGAGTNWMSGAIGNSIDADIQKAFVNMSKPQSESYSIFHLVGCTRNNDGSFKDIVQSNRWRDKGKENKGHPNYQLSPENQGYIDAWFSLTYNKWKNGPCP
jgi:hypothetical protein